MRLESEQQLSVAPVLSPSVAHKTRAPKWAPGSAQGKQTAVSVEHNAERKQHSNVETVVEYVVMQTRVMNGKPEEWKLWGFTSETTPERLQQDDDYWARMLSIQSSSA